MAIIGPVAAHGSSAPGEMLIPRGELQALLVTYRLVHTAIQAMMDRVENVCFFLDSTCSMDAVAMVSNCLKPFLQHVCPRSREYRPK